MKSTASAGVPKTLRSVSIVGTGSYLPDKILTNADLAKVMAGSDDARLASVLVKALLSGRYATSVPTLPELLLDHCCTVTATTAAAAVPSHLIAVSDIGMAPCDARWRSTRLSP